MRSFENYIEHIQAIRTIEELKREYARAIGARGYENCIVTSVGPGYTRHHAWFKSRTGPKNNDVERRWAVVAPLLRRSRNAQRPISWDNPVSRRDSQHQGSRPLGTRPAKTEHAGLAFPLRTSNLHLDIMSISKRSSASAASQDPLLLQAISDQTWARFQEIAGDSSVRSTAVPLTARELEILRWCKHGKTYAEISEILTISKKTVEFHLSNVMDKLGANNKVAAIVIAIQNGLIDLYSPAAGQRGDFSDGK